MTIGFAEKLLTWMAGSVIAFGLTGLAATLPALDWPIRFFADLVYWPVDGGQSLDDPTSRLLIAVAGGIMTGWGVLMYCLATQGLQIARDFSLRMIRLTILVWFVVDSLGSVLAGAPWNVLGNLIFLVGFGWPVQVLLGGQAAQHRARA